MCKETAREMARKELTEAFDGIWDGEFIDLDAEYFSDEIYSDGGFWVFTDPICAPDGELNKKGRKIIRKVSVLAAKEWKKAIRKIESRRDKLRSKLQYKFCE